MVIRAGLVPQIEEPRGRIYVLDFDAFVTEKDQPSEIDAVLDELHHQIQVEFLEHVTDEYKEIMRGKK